MEARRARYALLVTALLSVVGVAACVPESVARDAGSGGGGDATDFNVGDAAAGDRAGFDGLQAVDGGLGDSLGVDSASADRTQPDIAAPDSARADADAGFCAGLLNGFWCDSDDLVYCQDDAVASREPCPHGCVQRELGYHDQCAAAPADAGAADSAEPDRAVPDGAAADSAAPDGAVPDSAVPDAGAPDTARPDVEAPLCDPGYTPPITSSDAPTEDDRCTHMDWNLEVDGYYGISRFGTSEDDTTWGRGTSCGGLNLHYLTWCCQYDRHTQTCLDGGSPDFMNCSAGDPRLPTIPWVQGTVDYNTATVVNSVASYYFDAQGEVRPAAETESFPHPEYFYVAGAQRFNCGVTLRVTNPENGRCVVAYVEDGGPGVTYEKEGYCGRRILDSSPALHAFLEPSRAGWREPTKMMVEWGLPGDVPGQQCTPCLSTLAARGTEAFRNSFDINHYDAPNCRALADGTP